MEAGAGESKTEATLRKQTTYASLLFFSLPSSLLLLCAALSSRTDRGQARGSPLRLSPAEHLQRGEPSGCSQSGLCESTRPYPTGGLGILPAHLQHGWHSPLLGHLPSSCKELPASMARKRLPLLCKAVRAGTLCSFRVCPWLGLSLIRLTEAEALFYPPPAV